MKGDQKSQRMEARLGKKDSPLIAFSVQNSTDPNLLAGAILRARRNGFDTLVYSQTDPPEAITDIVKQLDTLSIWPDDLANDTNEQDTIVSRAKDMGYPGVLWNHELTSTVDFESSINSFQSGSDYDLQVEYDTSSPDRSAIVVGIPAYNEEISIGSVVLQAKLHAGDVFVVDDGSSDRTAAVAERAGATVVEHNRNRGKGAAMATLFDSVSDVDFDTLVVLDGDGQHLPEDIETVASPVLEGEADMVIGSRYTDSTETDETPLYRRFGQKVLDTLTTGTADAELSDTQSGFRAFSSAAVEQLEIETSGIGVESELVTQAINNDFGIKEVPISVRYDGIDGQTYNPVHHGFKIIGFLLSLIRDRHPLLFFGVPGVLLILTGVFFGTDTILIYRSTGNFYPGKAMLSGFAAVAGILGVFSGLILNQFWRMINVLEKNK